VDQQPFVLSVTPAPPPRDSEDRRGAREPAVRRWPRAAADRYWPGR
jgi:hypothetical protein